MTPNVQPATSTLFLRRQRLLGEMAYAANTLYRHIGQGLMTQPVKIGSRAVAWPSHEIEAIKTARLAGKADDEIRKLVASLHAARNA